MLKKLVITSLITVFFTLAQAQDGTSAFHFLQVPRSSHVAALGGENISIIEDDLLLATHNPALLSCVSNKTISLNYMRYIKGVNVAGAAFCHTVGERGTWAIDAQYFDYGDMKETTADNVQLGTFSAKDISLSGSFAYDLNDYWSGGVRASLIYNHYDRYTSLAMGVDLGLNYYNLSKDFSFSIVAQNLGGQIKPFEEKHEKLPFNLQIGVSKRLTHAPIRFSLTLHDLTHWNKNVTLANNWGNKLLNHINIGIDILPTENIYIAAGYNFRRSKQMDIAGESHWAGLCIGAGLRVKQFKISTAYAKYHISASSLLFNLSYTL